jgi:hypothetical protein
LANAPSSIDSIEDGNEADKRPQHENACDSMHFNLEIPLKKTHERDVQ